MIVQLVANLHSYRMTEGLQQPYPSAYLFKINGKEIAVKCKDLESFMKTYGKLIYENDKKFIAHYHVDNAEMVEVSFGYNTPFTFIMKFKETKHKNDIYLDEVKNEYDYWEELI